VKKVDRKGIRKDPVEDGHGRYKKPSSGESDGDGEGILVNDLKNQKKREIFPE